MQKGRVHELRLVVTTNDYEKALHFYWDVLGLEERAAFTSEGGRVSILEAGKATLELTDQCHADPLTRWKSVGASLDTFEWHSK